MLAMRNEFQLIAIDEIEGIVKTFAELRTSYITTDVPATVLEKFRQYFSDQLAGQLQVDSNSRFQLILESIIERKECHWHSINISDLFSANEIWTICPAQILYCRIRMLLAISQLFLSIGELRLGINILNQCFNQLPYFIRAGDLGLLLVSNISRGTSCSGDNASDFPKSAVNFGIRLFGQLSIILKLISALPGSGETFEATDCSQVSDIWLQIKKLIQLLSVSQSPHIARYLAAIATCQAGFTQTAAAQSSLVISPKRAFLTHHKCGTNFLLLLLDILESNYELTTWRKFYETNRVMSADWDIVYEQHSHIDELSPVDLHGIHCIRRPESLIVSATKYHETSDEPWLDIPLEQFDHNVFSSFTTSLTYNLIADQRIQVARKIDIVNNWKSPNPSANFVSPYSFQGRSYRQMLESFNSFNEKLIFEMHCYSYGVIADMLSFKKPNFINVKIEELSFDLSMSALIKCLQHLQFSEKECRDIANSAKVIMLGFDDKVGAGHTTTKLSDEWRQFFDGQVLFNYNRLFSSASSLLGY